MPDNTTPVAPADDIGRVNDESSKRAANVVPMARAASDLSRVLRDMADAVDSGEVTEFVGATVNSGEYEFYYSASLHSCIVLASMLWQRCVERMRT